MSSISKDQVTIVIPVKNEELAIAKVLTELLEEGYQNILVVDGYSSDQTQQIVNGHSNINFICQHGKGKTGAVKTAVEHVTTPYLLVIDGDYTYPAKDIQRLLLHGHLYDQVIGTRDRTNIPKMHRFGNKVITAAFNLLFGTKLSDVCSGMYLLKTDAAKQLALNTTGFATEVEIAAQTATNHSVVDVPIGYRERIGKRKLSTLNGFDIISAVLTKARKYNPVFFYSALTSLSLIPALGILGWVLFRQLTVGVYHNGWALIGVLLLLFSAQSISLAAISSLMKRIEQRLTSNIKNRN